ncbi:hypothetical protein G5I_05504 [Acromyrmex echinatior]|uniref:Uncharacterized protein n=1 Tax=Acromyrmex echinatior TaxID=103372 RepID=F4WII0_ACREC|nr:hypothetical protein G5I_05504 [Acromyrmex echinatior]
MSHLVYSLAIPYCRASQVKLTRSTVDQVDEWQLKRVRDRNNRVIEALTLSSVAAETIKVILMVYRNVRQVSTVATVREVVLNLFVQHDALREVCSGTCSASKCALSNVNVIDITRCDILTNGINLVLLRSAELVQSTCQYEAHPEGCFRLQLRHQRRVPETGDPLLYLGRQCGLIRGAGQIAGTPSASADKNKTIYERSAENLCWNVFVDYYLRNEEETFLYSKYLLPHEPGSH